MIYLNKKQIIKLQRQIIKEFGGISGIRDKNRLDSALSNPLQTFAGKDLYPDITEKIIRLGYSIIKNHPFLDGNKRTGLHSMLILFHLNGFNITVSHEKSIKKISLVPFNGIFLCAKKCSINMLFFKL